MSELPENLKIHRLPAEAKINPEKTYPNAFAEVFVQVDPVEMNKLCRANRLTSFSNQCELQPEGATEPDRFTGHRKRPSTISPLLEDRMYIARDVDAEYAHRAKLISNPRHRMMNGTHQHAQLGQDIEAVSLGRGDPRQLVERHMTFEESLTFSSVTRAVRVPVEDQQIEDPITKAALEFAKAIKGK